jgi:hypothetical protein
MARLIKPMFSVVPLLLALFATASGQSGIFDRFDAFGDLRCEDEYARLDNFAVHLQNEPTAKGVIIYYGGRRFRGRLPRRGDAAARAARLKPYLVQRRGIPPAQVIVKNGGFEEEFWVVLWIVPQGASLPDPPGQVPNSQIKFGKGHPRARDFRCRV